MMDFSSYPHADLTFTGAEEKLAILVDGQTFIVKFRKRSERGLLNNHFSEHLGSRIFRLSGIEAQETLLGHYGEREVVLCKHFINQGEVFTPFNGVGESSLEHTKYEYSYEYRDIERMLAENIKMTNVIEAVERFWDMYIVDALIGNFDRHGANWGFIKNQAGYRMAPVFDNGSSLFPRLNTDKDMLRIMEDPDEMAKRTFGFPTSQIRAQRRKSSYFDIINGLEYMECNAALTRMHKRIDMVAIDALLDATPEISETQRAFFKAILRHRNEHIIEASYKKLIQQEGLLHE